MIILGKPSILLKIHKIWETSKNMKKRGFLHLWQVEDKYFEKRLLFKVLLNFMYEQKKLAGIS